MTTTFPNIKDYVQKDFVSFIEGLIKKQSTKKDIFIKKYRPAYLSKFANTNCSLILTEGDSAASLFN